MTLAETTEVLEQLAGQMESALDELRAIHDDILTAIQEASDDPGTD